jgi:hypothetical protein
MRAAAVLVGLLAISLPACLSAPSGYSVTPIVRQVGPEEASRIVLDATSTARVAATQLAEARGTAYAAQATSTAAYRSTQDNLTVLATSQALAIMAGEATQAAQDALDARRMAQVTTYAAQTPTMAAIATQGALSATQAAMSQARAESAAEFWAWLRWTTVIGLASLALSFCVVVLTRGLSYVITEYQREQASIAREAFRLLAPGHWAEYTPGDGYRVYPLPGLLDAPATVIDNTPTTPDRAHAWRQAVRLFCEWGDRYGFTIGRLGASGAGVVSDPAWRTLTRLLRDAGVLADTALPGQKGRATAWAPGWDRRRLFDDLAHGRLVLPYPADTDPPAVAHTVPNMTTEVGQHDRTTQKGIAS